MLGQELAISNTEESLGIGMKCPALENLSIIVKITELASETGRPVTKSRAMCDQGCPRLGSGCSKADGGWMLFLFKEQVEHVATNSFLRG